MFIKRIKEENIIIELICEFCNKPVENIESIVEINKPPICCHAAQEEYINNNFDKIPTGQCHCVDCARDYFYGRELNKNCPYQILKIGVKSE